MARKSRELTRRLIGLGTASVAALVPARGQADPLTFGAGVFVNYAPATKRVEWGLEGFSTRRFRGAGCSELERTGVGALAQLGFLGWERPRVTLAAIGGGEFERNLLSLSGELGLTYRFATAQPVGVHIGVVPEVAFVNLAWRYQALLNEVTWGIGARVMPTFGTTEMCQDMRPNFVPGRPLRGAGGIASPAPASRLEPVRGSSADRIPELGLAWERDAQLEAASIPAFMQLACELHEHGAPTRLTGRALQAIRDEAFHAHGCAQLASAHLPATVVPTLPDVDPRSILPGSAGLARLAVESWLDGCLNEGRAARLAERSAELAARGPAGALQRQIASDERAHAELAWDVLRWSLARGGEPVREALRACRDHHQAGPAADVETPAGFEARGRLGAGEIKRLAEAHARSARARLDRELG